MLSLRLKNEILDLFSSEQLIALLLVGKIGRETSIELMKIVKSIDDDPESADLIFAFHHPFDTLKSYFTEIISEIHKNYLSTKDDLDPDGRLAPIFRYLPKDEPGSVTIVTNFIRQLSSTFGDNCRNLVFYLDPERITDPKIFNSALDNIINNSPGNFKLLILEDIESANQGDLTKKRKDVRHFVIPSTTNEIIEYMENELSTNKDLTGLQRYEIFHMLGNVYGSQNNLGKAVEKYDFAMKGFIKDKMLNKECLLLMDMAMIYYMQKDHMTSIKYYEKALERSTMGKLSSTSISCIKEISRIYLELKRKSDALQFYKKGLQLCDEINNLGEKSNFLSAIGDLYLESDQKKEAQQSFEEALSLNRKQGNFYGEAKELHKLSKIYQATGRIAEAKNFEEKSKQIQKEKGFSLDVPKTPDTNQPK